MNGIYAIPGESVQLICPVRLAPKGAVLMPDRNPGGYTCDTTGCAPGFGVWVKPYEKHKEECIGRFLATLDQGFSWYGVVYQCHEKDMIQWQRGESKMSKPDAPARITARAKDNSMQDMTKDRFLGLCNKAGETYETALRQYWKELDEWTG